MSKVLSINKGHPPIKPKLFGPSISPGSKPKRYEFDKAPTKDPSPTEPRLAYVVTPDGKRFTALCEGKTGGINIGRIAIPNEDGILLVNDEQVALPFDAEIRYINAEQKAVKIREFDHNAPYAINQKAMKTIREGELDLDYRDVMLEGFASTFGSPEDRDRDRDYILGGAFTRTIGKFMENPVMLTDHKNEIPKMAGSFDKVEEGLQGLTVTANLTNSPDMRHVRFLIVEGHLKSFSIGGLFFFGEDGHAIETVDLVEISLVAVPANPKATFNPKSLTASRAMKAFHGCQGSVVTL